MNKQEKQIYKNYFGEEPNIKIELNEAKRLKNILKEKLLNDKYYSVSSLTEDMEIYKTIKYKLKELEKTIIEITKEK